MSHAVVGKEIFQAPVNMAVDFSVEEVAWCPSKSSWRYAYANDYGGPSA